MKIVNLLLLLILIAGNCFAQRNTYINTETKNKIERWRISLAGGAGYMIAGSKESALISMGIPKQKARDFYKRYRLGWQGNADVHYLFNSYLGAGVKYSLFSSSSDIKGITNNGDRRHVFYGDLKEAMYVNYVGPSFIGQTFINQRKTWKVSALISYGYASYRSELYSLEIPRLITSDTFGGYDEIGIEYYVSKNIAVGFNIGYLFATFSRMNIEDKNDYHAIRLTKEERETVSRLNGSLTFRIYK